MIRTALLALTVAFHIHAADPLMVLTGDGLTVVVTALSEDAETASGEIRSNGRVYPFKATMQAEVPGGIMSGFYTDGERKVPFRLRESGNSDEAVFTAAGRTHRLRSADGDIPGPGRAPSSQAPARSRSEAPPFRESPGRSRSEVPPTSAQPPAWQPSQVPPSRQAPPAASAPVTAARTARPGTLRLKLHSFADVSMGIQAAYTVGLPPGWTAEGNVDWSTGPTPHPQQKFTIRSPGGGRYSTAAAVHFMYTEVIPVPGLPNMPASGIPAPRNFPQWYIGFVNRDRPGRVRPVAARRDAAAEAAWAEAQRGQQALGEYQSWVITTEIEEAGGVHREEATLAYIQGPPYANQNLRSQSWSVMPMSFVSAPAGSFDALAPVLHAVGASRRPTARWFVASQALLAELSRRRIEDFGALMRQRAREAQRISDQQMADYRSRMASSDRIQRSTINAIRERTDYVDPSGSVVNLPSHYDHVYSDGQGNFLLTNNSLDKPGVSWTEIEALR